MTVFAIMGMLLCWWELRNEFCPRLLRCCRCGRRCCRRRCCPKKRTANGSGRKKVNDKTSLLPDTNTDSSNGNDGHITNGQHNNGDKTTTTTNDTSSNASNDEHRSKALRGGSVARPSARRTEAETNGTPRIVIDDGPTVLV
jgi:hypothetical protein